MKKDTILSRRKFLVGSAGALGAGALAVVGGTGSLIKPRIVHAALGYLPYTTLDVEEVRRLAWKHYYNSGG